ncbi:hypothetical protein CRYUN_Cryun05aG0133300 [Craigia yunnanensis]
MESFNTHSYNCLLRGHDFPSRTGMNPIQENSFASGGNGPEAVENMFPTTEDDEAIKDSRNKHVESPSNP